MVEIYLHHSGDDRAPK